MSFERPQYEPTDQQGDTSHSRNRREGYRLSKEHAQRERGQFAARLRKARTGEGYESPDEVRGEVEQLYEDLPSRTIEETAKRTNAMFVHTFLENQALRHNELSNVEGSTTVQDDLDILLAFEPTVSASMVAPLEDERNEAQSPGTWGLGKVGGVILGHGRIEQAARSDMGTRALGLRERSSPSHLMRSNEELDNIAQSSAKGEGYNEVVVGEPGAIGYFMPCAFDDEGNAWMYQGAREKLLELHQSLGSGSDPLYAENLERFHADVAQCRARIQAARERGLPAYALTPDQRFFAIESVEDNGTLQLGEELTPASAVSQRGLDAQQRAAIGAGLLERDDPVFKNEATMREAQQVLESLKQQSPKRAAA